MCTYEADFKCPELTEVAKAAVTNTGDAEPVDTVNPEKLPNKPSPK